MCRHDITSKVVMGIDMLCSVGELRTSRQVDSSGVINIHLWLVKFHIQESELSWV